MYKIEEIKEIPMGKVTGKETTGELIKKLNLTYKKHVESVVIKYGDYKICHYSNKDLVNITSEEINNEIVETINNINKNTEVFKKTLLDMGYIEFKLSKIEPCHYEDYLFVNKDDKLNGIFRLARGYKCFSLEESLKDSDKIQRILDNVTERYNNKKNNQNYNDLANDILSTWK